jgi:hypothetical protein
MIFFLRYCISQSLVCDGVPNCDLGDESDEKYCELSFFQSRFYLFWAIIGGLVIFVIGMICLCTHHALISKDAKQQTQYKLGDQNGENCMQIPVPSIIELEESNSSRRSSSVKSNRSTSRKQSLLPSQHRDSANNYDENSDKISNFGFKNELGKFSKKATRKNEFNLVESEKKANKKSSSKIKDNPSLSKFFYNNNDDYDSSENSQQKIFQNNDEKLTPLSTDLNSLSSTASLNNSTELKQNNIVNFRQKNVNHYSNQPLINNNSNSNSNLRRNSYTKAIFFEEKHIL